MGALERRSPPRVHCSSMNRYACSSHCIHCRHCAQLSKALAQATTTPSLGRFRLLHFHATAMMSNVKGVKPSPPNSQTPPICPFIHRLSRVPAGGVRRDEKSSSHHTPRRVWVRSYPEHWSSSLEQRGEDKGPGGERIESIPGLATPPVSGHRGFQANPALLESRSGGGDHDVYLRVPRGRAESAFRAGDQARERGLGRKVWVGGVEGGRSGSQIARGSSGSTERIQRLKRTVKCQLTIR